MQQCLFLIFMITLITACVPIPRSYHKPFYNGGTLVGSNCSAGQKEKVEISLSHDAFVTVEASSSNSEAFIGQIYVFGTVEAPEGVELQFASDALVVKDLVSKSEWSLKLNGIQVAIDGEYQNLSPLTKVHGQTNFYEVLGGRKRFFNSGFSFSVSSNKIPNFSNTLV